MLRPHDDAPARTSQALAAVLELCEPSAQATSGGLTYYAFQHRPSGKRLPDNAFSWLELLSSGGGIPEVYAPLVIRIEEQMPEQPGTAARYLKLIGGQAAMAHRIRTYRRLADELAATGQDPAADFSSLEGRPRELVWNLQLTREGIERWAGRPFASVDQVEAWWSTAKAKSQPDWLRESLPKLAEQADAGNPRAQYLLRQLLVGALPNPPNHLVWLEPGQSSSPPPHAETAPPFRAKWLAEHGPRLQYIPDRGVFHLPKPADETDGKN
jgi:hypothetical protein